MKRVAVIVLTSEVNDGEASDELMTCLNNLKSLRYWLVERIIDTKI